MKKNVILLFIFIFTIILTLSSFKVSATSYNVNLASPDITDKEHLGNGVYRLYNNNDFTIDYNVYNGEYKINGTVPAYMNMILFDILPYTDYTLSYIGVSQSVMGSVFNLSISTPYTLIIQQSNQNINKENTFTTTTQTTLRFEVGSGRAFDKYTFKLQLEQGTIATPYKLPMGALRQHQELISGDLPSNFFQVLYDLMKDFIRSIAFVWIWLNDPIKIGFELPIIGYIGIPPFTPLSAFGIGILVVIGLWAVKSLVPMG